MIRIVPPGGGEVIGDAPDRRVELLADDDALHATWSRFGPNRAGADLHVHRRHTDLFYVLEGELVLLLGADGAPVRVPARTLARLPSLVVHGFRAGEAGVRYLNLHAPGVGFAEYLRALRDGRPAAYDQEPPPADGGRPPDEARIGERRVLADGGGLRVTELAAGEGISVREVRTDGAAPLPLPPHAPDSGVLAAYVLEGDAAGSWVQAPPGVPLVLPLRAGQPAAVLEIHAR